MSPYVKMGVAPISAIGRGIASFLRDARPSITRAIKGVDELPEGMERIIAPNGAMDYELLRAHRLRDSLNSAGHEGAKPFLSGQTINMNELRAAEKAVKPGWYGLKPLDPDVVSAGMTRAGIDLTPEQVANVVKARSPVRRIGRGLGRLYVGDKPIKQIHQRLLQGGILGKGGLIRGELSPPPGLARGAKRMSEQWKKKEYAKALEELPVGPAMQYGANLGFGFGMPAVTAYGAYEAAKEQGENPYRAFGSSATSALGTMVAAPFGMAQIHAYEPMENASRWLWGMDNEEQERFKSEGAQDRSEVRQDIMRARRARPSPYDRTEPGLPPSLPPYQRSQPPQPRRPAATSGGRMVRRMTDVAQRPLSAAPQPQPAPTRYDLG